MKRKIFTLLVLVATLLAGCGTATNKDVPTNGVTEAPSVTEQAEPTVEPTTEVEPTAEPTETVAPTEIPEDEPTVEPTEAPVVESAEVPEVTHEVVPTVEPTATPIPTSTPTPKPTATPVPTEVTVAEEFKLMNWEVIIDGTTIKRGEWTLGALVEKGIIIIDETRGMAGDIIDSDSVKYFYGVDGKEREVNFRVVNASDKEMSAWDCPIDCFGIEIAGDYSEGAGVEFNGLTFGDKISDDMLAELFGVSEDNVYNLEDGGSGDVAEVHHYVNSEVYDDDYNIVSGAYATFGTDMNNRLVQITVRTSSDTMPTIKYKATGSVPVKEEQKPTDAPVLESVGLDDITLTYGGFEIKIGETKLSELLEAELNYDIITGKNTFAPFNGQEKFVLPADSYTTVESTRGERLIVLNRDLQENKVATDCVITGIRMYNNYSSGNLANEFMLCGDLMVKKECGSIEQLVERFGSYDEVEEDDYLGTYTYTWNFGYPSDGVWLKIELYYDDWEDTHTIRYLEFNDLRSK